MSNNMLIQLFISSNKKYDNTWKNIPALRKVIKEELQESPESLAIEINYRKENENIEELVIAFSSPIRLLLLGKKWGRELERQTQGIKKGVIEIEEGNWRHGFDENFKMVFLLSTHLTEINNSIDLLRKILHKISNDKNPCVREDHFTCTPYVQLTLSFSDPFSLLEVGRIWGQAIERDL